MWRVVIGKGVLYITLTVFSTELAAYSQSMFDPTYLMRNTSKLVPTKTLLVVISEIIADAPGGLTFVLDMSALMIHSAHVYIKAICGAHMVCLCFLKEA